MTPRLINRGVRVLLLGGALLASGGCTPWHVVRQAVPNPLVGQRAFQLAPLDFQGLYVGEKPEPQYLAGKSQGQRASWQADLQAMTQTFAERFVSAMPGCQVTPPGGTAPFLVAPHISFIEPGFFIGIASAPSRVQMMLRVQSGRDPVDEIDVEVSVPADFGNAAVGTRLREAAADLGDIAARYLRERAGM